MWVQIMHVEHNASRPGPAITVRLVAAIAVLAPLALPSVTEARAEDARKENCTVERGPVRAVARVLDAETIALDDGGEVRLIGALAPRAPGHETGAGWPPERDAIVALETLLLGRTVELGFAGRRTDRYRRLMAHVFVERVWVQGHMLSRGHARAYGLPGSFACMDELMAHERIARAARIGLWANAAYAERSALRTRSLMRLRNTYQIVGGRVVQVAEIKGRIYLNFGNDWRQDFTAGVAASTARGNRDWAAALKALEGKRVKVRGWIERRNGPFIEILDRSQIEIADDGGRPDQQRGPHLQPPGAETSSGRPEAQAPEPSPSPDTKPRPAQDAPGAVDL